MEIRDCIKSSDFVRLKKVVDNLQKSLLCFDDPSLLLMAIEVFLDPQCVKNSEYQYDIILFLVKSGMRVWVPNNINFLMYISNWINQQQDLEQEEKLKQICDLLVEHGHTYIFEDRISVLLNINLQEYLTKQWAAIKIQTWWKRNKEKKREIKKRKEIKKRNKEINKEREIKKEK